MARSLALASAIDVDSACAAIAAMTLDDCFPPGDPIDTLDRMAGQEESCAECGAPPDVYCVRGCPAQDTTSRSW